MTLCENVYLKKDRKKKEAADVTEGRGAQEQKINVLRESVKSRERFWKEKMKKKERRIWKTDNIYLSVDTEDMT